MGCDAASPDSAMVPTRGCCRDASAVGGGAVGGAAVVTALVGLVAMVGARSLACSFSMCASSAACNASSPAPGSRSAVGWGYHGDATVDVAVAVGRPVTGAATDVKADTGCCTPAPATTVDGPAAAVEGNLAVGTGRAVTLAAAAPPCMVQVLCTTKTKCNCLSLIADVYMSLYSSRSILVGATASTKVNVSTSSRVHIHLISVGGVQVVQVLHGAGGGGGGAAG